LAVNDGISAIDRFHSAATETVEVGWVGGDWGIEGQKGKWGSVVLGWEDVW